MTLDQDLHQFIISKIKIQPFGKRNITTKFQFLLKNLYFEQTNRFFIKYLWFFITKNPAGLTCLQKTLVELCKMYPYI